METLKKPPLYFRKHKLLKSYIFGNGTFRARILKKAHSEKMSYISGNRTFYPQA